MATVNIEYEEYEAMKKTIEHQRRVITDLELQNRSIDQEAITRRILKMGMQVAEDVLTKALRCNGIVHPKEISPRAKLFEFGWYGEKPDDFWWMHPPYQIEVKPEAMIVGHVKTLWFDITKLQEPEQQ